MNILIVSYSLTGNNDALAASLAAACGGTHARITESKPRSTGSIALDMLFGRIPRVNAPSARVDGYDVVIVVAPIWMGSIASPVRAWLRDAASTIGPYAFVSLSGGSDGPNPRIGADLAKRLGKAPTAVVDLHIADLLPPEPKPARADTSAYRVNDAHLRVVTDKALTALRDARCIV